MTTVINAVAGYFFLMLTVRLLTRRPGAQMTMFEFVIVFLVGESSSLLPWEMTGRSRTVAWPSLQWECSTISFPG
jgi:hypothetical protein